MYDNIFLLFFFKKIIWPRILNIFLWSLFYLALVAVLVLTTAGSGGVEEKSCGGRGIPDDGSSLFFSLFSSSRCLCSPASTFLLQSLTMVELLLKAAIASASCGWLGAKGGWWFFFFLCFPYPLFLPSLLFLLLFFVLFLFLLSFCWWWSCCR